LADAGILVPTGDATYSFPEGPAEVPVSSPSVPEESKPDSSKKGGSASESEESEPWWKHRESDWTSKGSEKADRDFTFETIWATLVDPNADWTKKIGVAMLTLVQYFYRR